jgi:hypothetical protein
LKVLKKLASGAKTATGHNSVSLLLPVQKSRSTFKYERAKESQPWPSMQGSRAEAVFARQLFETSE